MPRRKNARDSRNPGPLLDRPLHVLLLGSGGREHALGWRIKQSKHCGKLFFAPGNAGTASLGTNVDLPITYSQEALDPDKPTVSTKSVDAIDYFCRQHDIGLIVVGPEDPLAHGIVDRLHQVAATRGITRHIFGPSHAAARLEGDKAFAKDLMRAASIPTADARTFTGFDAAAEYVQNRETPVVVKAAGLAKGKGAIVTSNSDEAVDALRRCMVRREFGDAGNTVIVEERLTGQEVSLLALVDGRNIFLLDPCQDHKPVGEGDTGPNTGGMGAYCPTPLLDERTLDTVQRQVLVPIVDALRRDDVPFQGVLYAGLMLTPGGPKVLEFNTRFGDPETQPLMMRFKGDLLATLVACCTGRLEEAELGFDPRVALGVVMASGGYPGEYRTGLPIHGIEDAEHRHPDVKVFHGGTRLDRDGTVVTGGGRVLCVTALGGSISEAQAKANAACEKITFDAAHWRRDIGGRVR